MIRLDLVDPEPHAIWAGISKQVIAPAFAMDLAEWFVTGKIASAGNKRQGRNGHIYESTLGAREWRDLTVAHTQRALMQRALTPIVEGPVYVGLLFIEARPKTMPKWRRWKTTKPDIDKLQRNTLDGLTQAGAIGDDAQIVLVNAAHIVTNETLTVPGCVIHLGSLNLHEQAFQPRPTPPARHLKAVQ